MNVPSGRSTTRTSIGSSDWRTGWPERRHLQWISHRMVEPGVRERIEAAVDDLPEIYRTVFLMHDLEGYNHGEIAAALDVAEGTSKARLSRARAKLRETLGPAMQEYV